MILKFVVGLVLVVLTNAAPAAVKYVFDVQEFFADNGKYFTLCEL